MLPYQKVQNKRPRTKDRSRPISELIVISTSAEPSLKRCESPCGYQTIEKYTLYNPVQFSLDLIVKTIHKYKGF